MNIFIIGTGYVGLVTGVCFADAGFSVTCHDIDESRIDRLKKGDVPFYEPGLSEMILNSLAAKNLSFSSSLDQVNNHDVIFVCVGTPDSGDGTSDLTALNIVFRSLQDKLTKDALIFIKSTVPMGTNQKVVKNYPKLFQNTKFNIELASNPEFLKEGDAINDFKKPDRIIVGTNSKKVKDISYILYKPFNWQRNRLVFMSPDSAELTKYAANSMLAMRITFMNELSRLCDASQANIHEIRNGIGSDKRVGRDFLYSGIGYGGSCFPKDVASLKKIFEQDNVQSDLISSIDKANEQQINYFFEKITKHFDDKSSSKNLLIWGLSFKPNTDDIRESVSIKLVKKLSPIFKKLYLYDPIAASNAEPELKTFRNLEFIDSQYDMVEDSNALILCTEWKEFWHPDLNILRNLKDRIIFDGRNLYDPLDLAKFNISHVGIGT